MSKSDVLPEYNLEALIQSYASHYVNDDKARIKTFSEYLLIIGKNIFLDTFWESPLFNEDKLLCYIMIWDDNLKKNIAKSLLHTMEFLSFYYMNNLFTTVNINSKYYLSDKYLYLYKQYDPDYNSAILSYMKMINIELHPYLLNLLQYDFNNNINDILKRNAHKGIIYFHMLNIQKDVTPETFRNYSKNTFHLIDLKTTDIISKDILTFTHLNSTEQLTSYMMNGMDLILFTAQHEILMDERIKFWQSIVFPTQQLFSVSLETKSRYLTYFPLLTHYYKSRFIDMILIHWGEFETLLDGIDSQIHYFIARYACELMHISVSWPRFYCTVCEYHIPISLTINDCHQPSFLQFTEKYSDFLRRRGLKRYMVYLSNHHCFFKENNDLNSNLNPNRQQTKHCNINVSTALPTYINHETQHGTIMGKLTKHANIPLHSSLTKVWKDCFMIECALQQLLVAFKKDVGSVENIVNTKQHFYNYLVHIIQIACSGGGDKSPLIFTVCSHILLNVTKGLAIKEFFSILPILLRDDSCAIPNFLVSSTIKLDKRGLLRLSNLLGCANIQTFLAHNLRYVLCGIMHLVCLKKCSVIQLKALLDSFCKIYHCTMSEFLGIQNGKYLFNYFYGQNPDVWDEFEKLIVEFTNTTFIELIVSKKQDVIQELFFDCGTNPTIFIYKSYMYLNKIPLEATLTSDCVVPSFIDEKMYNIILGILYRFETVFRKTWTNYFHYKRCLEHVCSFLQFMHLLTEQIAYTYKGKLLAIIHTLSFQANVKTYGHEYVMLIIDCIRTLITKLALSGPLKEISIDILMICVWLIEKYSSSSSMNVATKILAVRDILFDNLDKLYQPVCCLLICNVPPIQKQFRHHICLNRIYKDYQSMDFSQIPCHCSDSSYFRSQSYTATNEQGLMLNFESILKYTIQGISLTSYNIKARTCFLINFYGFIKYQPHLNNHLFLYNDTYFELYTHLVRIAGEMLCKTDHDSTVTRNECLKVLKVIFLIFGCFGFIDIKRFSAYDQTDQKSVMTPNQPKFEKFDLLIDLFQILTTYYLNSKESRQQDTLSYAIQEILSILHENNYDVSALAVKLPNMSMIIKYFSASHFSIIDHICMEPIDTCIISFLLKQNAGTNETTNSSLTVSKWANYLASRLIGKLPKSHAIDKIFQICLKISPYNPTLILQVLPYIFLRVITTNNGNLLHEEINGFAQISNHIHQSMLTQDVLDGVKECVQSFVKSIHLFFKWWNYQSKCLNDKIMSSRPLNQPKLKKIRGEGINTYAEQFYHNLNYMHLSQMARLYNPYHSLYFYEIHLKLTGNNNNYNNGNIEKMTDTFKYLSCLYQSINETDYIHGLYTFDVMADTLEQRIFMESSKGNFNECLTLYEQQLAATQTKVNNNSSLSSPNKLNHSINIVDTLLLLEQNECAHHFITSLQARHCNWQQNLKQYSDECYLRLGQWEDIELYGCTDAKETSCHMFDIVSPTSKDFDLIKRLPGLFYNGTYKYSCESDNPIEIYENLSPFLTYHHVMKDYETLKYLQHSATDRQQNNDNINLKYIERLSNSKADFFTRQNIINGLKNIFRKEVMSHKQTSLKLYKKELGMLYLENAKQARKFGYQQIALKNLMQSEPYNLKRFHLEKAKWHKVNNTFDEAFYSLNKCITLRPSTDDNDSSDKLNYNSTTILAKAHKLKGQFSQILGRENLEHIIKSYQDAINLNPEWESGYFCMAKYFDQLYQFNPQSEMACEYMQKCIQNYGLSIIHGSKHVYQSLPRMISNWLDFGEIKPPHNFDPTKYQESMKKINSFMTDLIEHQVASSTFLLVFSQLLSRICHTNDSVWKVLKLFLSTLLTHHVEKCFWLITAVFKSQLPQRIQRCKEICLQVFANNTRVSKYINDAIQLADKLLEIAVKPIETVIDVKLSREFRYLPKLFENTEFSQILLPIQSQLNMYANGKSNSKPMYNSNLLKNGKRLKQDHSSEQTPTYIYIVNVKDEIEVIQSQQKPKKITFLASDGQFYSLLCKPKDDLRKDFRLMEFNMLVNCCLKQASDSRKRNLSIKTYSAIPLNEDCGLIEWVNHVQPLRTILIKLYQEEGKYLSTKELFSYKIPVTHNKTKKLDAYQKLVKYYSPPIFCEWFRRNFDETSLWYEAKLRYSRSLAVMSMVGYILGLGDRHGENILIDTLTGHILHVDFNCLFNKGLSLEYPEVVEFRLTQNMIDAMGPIRYEGPFRISCEITLKILRDHHDLLMNIIRPFIHDPLLEWRDVMYYNSNEIQSSQILPSRLKKPGSDANSSLTLIKANRHVINIEKRLKGQLNYLGGIDKIYSIKPYAKSLILASYKLGTDDPPLSIQGQVDFLIKQCIDENLLCQMYVGWSPFL